ncbi:MAG: hypothetical protein QOC65_1063 [Sphingomonadales bacterium]|nr:hypothetical protein [Sphingomonadales bacterium]
MRTAGFSLVIAAAAAISAPAIPQTNPELRTREADRDVIPAYFRGEWARTPVQCRHYSEGRFATTATAINAYEAEGLVQRVAGVVHHMSEFGDAQGRVASPGYHSVVVRALFAGEGTIWDANIVLTRVGDRLAMTREGESVTVGDLNVRCTARVEDE